MGVEQAMELALARVNENKVKDPLVGCHTSCASVAESAI